MSRQNQHSLAFIPCGQVPIQTVVAKEGARVLRRIAPHPAKFRQQPAEVPINPLKNLSPLRGGLSRKGQFEIAIPGAPQPRKQNEGGISNRRSHASRQPPRKRSQEVHQGPYEYEFKSSAHPPIRPSKDPEAKKQQPWRRVRRRSICRSARPAHQWTGRPMDSLGFIPAIQPQSALPG